MRLIVERHEGERVIRFSESNWRRFFTHGKSSTIRTRPIKAGEHVVFGGSRFKPKRLGRVLIGGWVKKFVWQLSVLEAKADGFDSRDELLMELARLNRNLTPDSEVYVHECHAMKEEKEAGKRC